MDLQNFAGRPGRNDVTETLIKGETYMGLVK